MLQNERTPKHTHTIYYNFMTTTDTMDALSTWEEKGCIQHSSSSASVTEL